MSSTNKAGESQTTHQFHTRALCKPRRKGLKFQANNNETVAVDNSTKLNIVVGREMESKFTAGMPVQKPTSLGSAWAGELES